MHYSQDMLLTIAHSMFAMAKIVREMKEKADRTMEMETLTCYKHVVEDMAILDIEKQLKHIDN